MRYDYHCEACKKVWEEDQSMANRNVPIEQPCPHCGEKTVKRGFFHAAHFSYEGSMSNVKRAGSGWNDVLMSIKRASGKENSIETR